MKTDSCLKKENRGVKLQNFTTCSATASSKISFASLAWAKVSNRVYIHPHLPRSTGSKSQACMAYRLDAFQVCQYASSPSNHCLIYQERKTHCRQGKWTCFDCAWGVFIAASALRTLQGFSSATRCKSKSCGNSSHINRYALKPGWPKAGSAHHFGRL